MQEVGGQIFPPTLHACACVHKLYVLIQAFMHPFLITKLHSFSSLSGLQNLKLNLKSSLHRSDRKNGKCLIPYLSSSQGLLRGNET